MFTLLIYFFSIRLENRIVNYRFYIPESTKSDFSYRSKSIEELIQDVTLQLEATVNSALASKDNDTTIRWSLELQNDTVNFSSLSQCGSSISELTSKLAEYYFANFGQSTIFMIDCSSSDYEDFFSRAHVSTPYLTEKITGICTTATLIFFEPELQKFTAMFGTALLKAAGVSLDNPLKLEEVTNGDHGTDIIMTVEDEALKQLKNTFC